MKRYTILVGTILAAYAALPGCSKNGAEPQSQGPAVVLGAGMADGETPTAEKATAADPVTRTAINPDDPFTAAIAGWETTGTPDYGAASTWQSGFTAVAGTAQPVQLTPQAYYNLDGKVKTYMKAWHPAGTLAADGTVTFAGTEDGTTDVMLTDVISGSSEDMQNKNLEFSHLLCQLRFRVRSATELTMKPTLTSLTVKEVQLPTGLNLVTDAVIYAPAAAFAVTGIVPGQIRFETTAQGAGAPLLLRPFAGNMLTVDIVTSEGTYPGVVATIDGDADFIPGKAYTITLTYNGHDSQPLGATVSVAPWQDTAGGDIDLPL